MKLKVKELELEMGPGWKIPMALFLLIVVLYFLSKGNPQQVDSLRGLLGMLFGNLI